MCPHGLFVHVEREGEKEREGEGGEREKLLVSLVSLIRTVIISGLHNFFLVLSLWALAPSTVPLWVRASAYKF